MNWLRTTLRALRLGKQLLAEAKECGEDPEGLIEILRMRRVRLNRAAAPGDLKDAVQHIANARRGLK